MVAMSGASMPAPLAMPATVKVGCSTRTSLRPESVVMMPWAASAAASAESDRAATSVGMPDSIGAMGSGIPMSPVEHTRTWSVGHPEALGDEGAHPLGVGPSAGAGGGVGVPAADDHGPRSGPGGRQVVAADLHRRGGGPVGGEGGRRRDPVPSSVATRARSRAPDALMPGGQARSHEPLGRW